METATKLLLYDPDHKLGKTLGACLPKASYKIRGCTAPQALYGALREFAPHLILLACKPIEEGAMLPLLALVRSQKYIHFALVVVLEHENERAEVHAYNLGADAVLFAPLREQPLNLRLQAIIKLKAKEQPQQKNVKVGGLLIDTQSQSAWLHGLAIQLAKREFDILYQLSQVPGKIYERAELLELGAQTNKAGALRAVDVHICMLRSKLPVKSIVTLRGKGYYLNKTKLEFMPREIGLAVSVSVGLV